MKRYFTIRNLETGAELRVPRTIHEPEMRFENPDHATRPLEVKISEIDEWNGRQHCVFGQWEALCQNRRWGDAVRAVCGDSSPKFVVLEVEVPGR